MLISKQSTEVKRPTIKPAKKNRFPNVKRRRVARKKVTVIVPPATTKVEVGEEVGLVDLTAIIEKTPTLASAKKKTKEEVSKLLELYNDIKRTHGAKRAKIKPFKKVGETLCLGFSDWHMGKVVQSDKDGTICFDSEICYERITKELIPRIHEYILKTGAQSRIEDIAIFFAGDIVDNDMIYDTQRFHIDKAVAEQFHSVTRAIMEMIFGLKGLFNQVGVKDIPIRIYGIPGNHGRPSRASKDEGKCSWDYAVYSSVELALAYSKLTNVSFKFTHHDRMFPEIRGHKFLIQHDCPAQSETSSTRARFGGWYEKYKFDLIFFGHRHHWGVSTYHGRPLVMNGSLCGTDDLANKMAVGCGWAQMMWVTTNDKTISNIQPIE